MQLLRFIFIRRLRRFREIKPNLNSGFSHLRPSVKSADRSPFQVLRALLCTELLSSYILIHNMFLIQGRGHTKGGKDGQET